MVNSLVVQITDTEKKYLEKAINGQGGFQSLLKKLYMQTSGYSLTLFPKDVERIIRYANNYGKGGFETRLKSILNGVRTYLQNKQNEKRRTS